MRCSVFVIIFLYFLPGVSSAFGADITCSDLIKGSKKDKQKFKEIDLKESNGRDFYVIANNRYVIRFDKSEIISKLHKLLDESNFEISENSALLAKIEATNSSDVDLMSYATKDSRLYTSTMFLLSELLKSGNVSITDMLTGKQEGRALPGIYMLTEYDNHGVREFCSPSGKSMFDWLFIIED